MNGDNGVVKDHLRLEVISVDECWSLMEQSVIGRIAFLEAGEPVILPVTYQLDGHSIVFRSSAGSKLLIAGREGVVGFEVDDYDADQRTGWSVVLRGVCERMYDDEDIERSGVDGLTPWAKPNFPTHPIRIRVSDVSGRRILS